MPCKDDHARRPHQSSWPGATLGAGMRAEEEQGREVRVSVEAVYERYPLRSHSQEEVQLACDLGLHPRDLTATGLSPLQPWSCCGV